MKTKTLLPELPAHETRKLPAGLVESLRELMGACQMFGSASGRRASIEECNARMQILKDKTTIVLQVIQHELTARYEAGIEIGRSEE